MQDRPTSRLVRLLVDFTCLTQDLPKGHAHIISGLHSFFTFSPFHERYTGEEEIMYSLLISRPKLTELHRNSAVICGFCANRSGVFFRSGLHVMQHLTKVLKFARLGIHHLGLTFSSRVVIHTPTSWAPGLMIGTIVAR